MCSKYYLEHQNKTKSYTQNIKYTLYLEQSRSNQWESYILCKLSVKGLESMLLGHRQQETYNIQEIFPIAAMTAWDIVPEEKAWFFSSQGMNCPK